MMIDVFVIFLKLFYNKKSIIALPFDFFFLILPKRRRQQYGMGDRQNGIIEEMRQVILKKLIGDVT